MFYKEKLINLMEFEKEYIVNDNLEGYTPKNSFYNFILKDFMDLYHNSKCTDKNNTLSTLLFITAIISTSLFLGCSLLGVYVFTIWSLILYNYTSTLIMFIIETIIFSPFVLLPLVYFLIKIYIYCFLI